MTHQYQAIPFPPTDWSARWAQRLVSEIRRTFSEPVHLDNFTVATLPSAMDLHPGTLIFVTNETGGSVPAFSDGTNWRRVTDRAIVS